MSDDDAIETSSCSFNFPLLITRNDFLCWKAWTFSVSAYGIPVPADIPLSDAWESLSHCETRFRRAPNERKRHRLHEIAQGFSRLEIGTLPTS